MPTPVSTSERVYQELRQMVALGTIAPGDRLVQRQLAAQLGVSSIPVIEATRRLQQDGLVVLHPNWGAQVREWSDADVESAHKARAALESLTADLFVRNAGLVARARLADLAREYDEAVGREDRRACFETDMELHGHIARASESKSLIPMVEISCLLTLTLGCAVRSRVGASVVFPEPGVHQPLVEALLSGNPRTAVRAARLHVRNGYRELRALMDFEQAVKA